MTWFPGDFKWKSGPLFFHSSCLSLALTNVVFGSKFKILSFYVKRTVTATDRIFLSVSVLGGTRSQFCATQLETFLIQRKRVTKRVMNPGENACLMEWPICWMTPKQIESIVSTPLLKFFLTSSMEKVLYTIPSNTIRVFTPLFAQSVEWVFSEFSFWFHMMTYLFQVSTSTDEVA